MSVDESEAFYRRNPDYQGEPVIPATSIVHYPRADGPLDSVLCACSDYQYDGWSFPEQGLPPDFWQHAGIQPVSSDLRTAIKDLPGEIGYFEGGEEFETDFIRRSAVLNALDTMQLSLRCQTHVQSPEASCAECDREYRAFMDRWAGQLLKGWRRLVVGEAT